MQIVTNQNKNYDIKIKKKIVYKMFQSISIIEYLSSFKMKIYSGIIH